MTSIVHSLSSKTEEAMKCRVFIGNLPTEAVSKDVIKNLFSPYGSYIDCSIYKNFGFVQYNDEESALKAVESLNGHSLAERRLDIKIATSGRKEKQGGVYSGVSKQKKPFRPNFNAIQPLMSRPVYDPNYNMPPPTYPYNSNSNLQGYGYNSPQMPHPGNQYQYPMVPNASMKPPSVYPIVSTPGTSQVSCMVESGPDTLNMKKLCDIICTSKKQLSYAEFVEYTVSKIGVSCNINILGQNYPSDAALSRLSRSGMAFAISLKDENEAHRSCNLHIFSSTPEEHRNMPLNTVEEFLCDRFGFNPKPPTNQPPTNTMPSGYPQNHLPPQTIASNPQKPYQYQNMPNAPMNPSMAAPTTGAPKSSANENAPAIPQYSHAQMYSSAPYYSGYRPNSQAYQAYYQNSQAYSNAPASAPYSQIPAYPVANSGPKRE